LKPGADNKALFITSLLFEKQIKTVKVDLAAMDYYMRLTTLYGQFRAVGVNYNQIVKILYRNFSEKKAAAYLFKLKTNDRVGSIMSCHNAINGRIELKHLKKGENDSKICRGANIIGALSYNQLKVDQENGSIHRLIE
jgi:hypothetical protein